MQKPTLFLLLNFLLCLINVDSRTAISKQGDMVYLGETTNSRFYKSVEEVDLWWAEAECGRMNDFDDGFGVILEEAVKYNFLVEALERTSSENVETYWVGGIVRDNVTEADCQRDTLQYCFYWWPCTKNQLGSFVSWENPRMSNSRFSDLSNMYLIQKKGSGITFDFDDTTALKKYICEVPRTDSTPNCS